MGNVIPMAFAKFFWIHLLASDDPDSQCIRMQCKKGETVTENDITTIKDFFVSRLDEKVEISALKLKRPETLAITVNHLTNESYENLLNLIEEIQKN